MNKYTQRGEFIDLKNVRIRNDKAFIKEKNNKRNKTNIKLIKNLHNFFKEEHKINSNNIKTSLLKGKNSESNLSNLESHLISTEHFNNNHNSHRSIFSNSNKSKTYSNFYSKEKTYNNDKSKFNNETKHYLNKNLYNQKYLKSSLSEQKIRGPNFKKNISRQYLEKLRKLHNNNYMISYDSPNYSFVREKIDSNVKYADDNKKYKNKTRKRLFIGIEPNINFDPNKFIDKYNNHLSTKVPDFNLMSSRFSKKNNTLPCYMQKIFHRGSSQNINEKTLELNNYSIRDLRSSKSYFFPKRSFNNIINLNLINSSLFKNKDKNEEIKEKIDIIKNEISFNHKGYEELIKEGALNRFDGVTYKSIIRNKKNVNGLLYKHNNINIYG